MTPFEGQIVRFPAAPRPLRVPSYQGDAGPTSPPGSPTHTHHPHLWLLGFLSVQHVQASSLQNGKTGLHHLGGAKGPGWDPAVGMGWARQSLKDIRAPEILAPITTGQAGLLLPSPGKELKGN